MGVTSYLTFDGEILGEDRAGGELDYLSDPLGSVVAMTDNSGTVASSRTYWPYGESKMRSGSWTTAFGFVGALGYYQDPWSATYVRARVLRPELTRWQTLDHLWVRGVSDDSLFEMPYAYALANPTTHSDASGLSPFQCEKCAYALGALYFFSSAHDCNHKFIHCYVCCVLSHEMGADCALSMQDRQAPGPDPSTPMRRMKACMRGIAGDVPTAQCESHCAKAFPKPDHKDKGCKDHKPSVPFGGHLRPSCYAAWHPFEGCFKRWWSESDM